MTSLRQALEKELSAKELKLVPNSFDVVGNIAIFSEFPKELKRKKRKLIGNTLLKLNKNIKTVAIKTGKYSGRYRTPKLKIIAGEKTKETTHTENGVRIKLNVEKCYFSARTGTERLRIAKQIKKGEEVLVMFAGVLPFALIIARHSRAKEIYAVEINAKAYKYGLENIKLNKIKNIKSFKGDVDKILPRTNKKFDRILMPLPKSSDDYLELALSKLKKGGVIHFYTFVNENEFPDAAVKRIKKFCKPKILKITKCGHYAPYTYRVCVDFRPFSLQRKAASGYCCGSASNRPSLTDS
ncbi:MAG: class I SAM-dependent methyltransferase family protein [Nanoarchaeota archaeon]|nr:class I SAM-dependent methyltransferase family protein [Nanoarchaeota archaeon]